MFKWRSDKIRITAVFKLQFHATQINEYGGNGLVVSVVPAENGKPTARLEKSRITDNCCYWENPVFETVKFIQDPKTNKIHDRIYYFLISTGSPKGSLVGEFSVNIADYIAATKACPVSFPFKNSNSDSYLHVTIQRVQENNNLTKVERDLEENESVSIKQDDNSLKRHFSNGDVAEGAKSNLIEEQPLRKTASHTLGLNGTRRGSNGSDITLSSSDSSSGLNTPRDGGVRNINTCSKDQTSNSSGYQDQQKTQWDLAIVPVNDSSTEYSMNSPRDIFPSLRTSMGLEDSVDVLKADLVALSRRAEVSELELHTLRKQIVKESKKGQDMMREITSLKEERNTLKDECEKLKASRKRSDDLRVKSKFQFEGDPWALIDVIREELDYEKEMNSNLRLQLQKTQDANEELLLAVQDLEEMLEKNNKGVSHAPNRSISGESAVEIEDSILKSQSDDDEQKALEDLVRQHSDAQETYMLEQKIMDLCSEIEMYRRDKDELEMQMEQLALDYEILKQENHEYSTKLEQSHLQEQLKMQCDGSSPYTVVRELEAKSLNLENELNDKSEELSHCYETIKELEASNQNLTKELQKKAAEFEAGIKAATSSQMEQQQRADQAEASLNEADAIINELESVIEKLKNERKKHLEELSSSLASIKELKTHNYDLEDELENQAQRFEADMQALTHAKTEQEQRALKAEEAVAHSSATVNELETHIKKLEDELKRHSEESSENLTSVKELEAHIQYLEEELEKQAEGFEADLEAVTHAKVEQEQRAIRAEESLKLMRWKNANTAARIQDEFKRLSSQMQSSFEANEKLASKALTEASELRLQNRHLQDMLQNAREELQSAKEEYETKMQEMNSQFNVKSTQIEQMEMEIKEKSTQLETQKKQTDELQRSVSGQQLDHRSEIERLMSENKSLVEQMKALTEERDMLVQRENTYTECSIPVKEVAGKSLEELNMLRKLKDEKEQAITNLKSEVEELRDQCENLKHSVYEDEAEKESLRKQVFQLKSDLKKKDEAILSIEKKFKENNGRVVAQDKPKATSKNSKSEPVQRSPKEVATKEVVTLKERIKFLEGQIKSKEAALETSTNAFLTKEKDLHGKIEELEINLRELNQSNPDGDHDEVKQEKISVGTQVSCVEEVTSASDECDEANVTDKKFSNVEEPNSEIESDSQPKPSDNDPAIQQKFDVLLKEMVLLKEQNKSMEFELNEMQERYSEISLKFAEVEGERQQLIMRVRNLKNAKKT